MQIYNTLTRKKEPFVPREPGKVAMYACGPTVYNHIHIGNARTFLTFDVMRRYLVHSGYEVTFVQNITDVDDKIINRAAEEGRSAAEVAADYTEAFIGAMRRFGIEDPDVRPRATEEIPEMIELVERLVDGGHAYATGDGNVYFSVRSWPGYGKLSGRNIDDLRSGARVDIDERKRDPLDFALWKAAKPGEPHWSSPWGEGRPGWHLECSVMSEKYLGLPLDIHGGGSDLVFPHHENEVAQSEAASGGTFARYWVHGGMLNINSEKMSKSLGNFLLLTDVLDTCDPTALRLLMLQTHYRSPLDFSDARLAEAASSLERIETAVRNLRWAAGNAPEVPGDDELSASGDDGPAAPDGSAASDDAAAQLDSAADGADSAFHAAMDDDFNTAGALGAVFTLASAAFAFLEANPAPDAAGRDAASHAAATIESLLGVLGIQISPAGADEWPAEVCALARDLAGCECDDPHAAADALLAARADARSQRDFALADAVRDGLAALGFTVEDTPAGTRLTYDS